MIIKRKLITLLVLALSATAAWAQEAEMLSVADAFQFSVRSDYTADGSNTLSRPYQSRLGIEGWDNHSELAIVMTTDWNQAEATGQTYQAPAEAVAAKTLAQPVVYQVTPEGFQNVTFFSLSMQYAYVLYFAPELSQTWLLVSRIDEGMIRPLYQLSNDLSLLPEGPDKEAIVEEAHANRRDNIDAFVSLAGRLASGQYHGINYIEK